MSRLDLTVMPIETMEAPGGWDALLGFGAGLGAVGVAWGVVKIGGIIIAT